MLTLTLAVVLAAICLVAYVRKMAPFYILSEKMPGPRALPLIGSAWKFIGKSPEAVLHAIHDMTKAYESPTRFWLGPKLVVAISDPENARIVLSSNRMNQKGYIYRLLEPLVGNGLISGSGVRWKLHRKLIQPFLNNDFVDRTLNLFLQNFSESLLHALEDMVYKTFDVQHIIHAHVADVLAITIFGYDIETRNGKNVAFLTTPKKFYQLMTHRITRPWLQLDELFKLTKLYNMQNKMVENVDSIVFKAIENAKSRIRDNNINNDSPLIDKLLNAMLQNPGVMTDAELCFQLKTLFIASEDTVVNHSCYALACLGMAAYSNHQKVIFKEIELLPPYTKITDPLALPHLTKCIKEVLRLFPAGPHLFRETMDHFQLGDLILPPACTVLVNTWGIHRDPKQWKCPDEFYPQHFESDAVSKRHPSSFIPFSMGARACAGKALAYPFLKLVVAKVLEKFIVEADGGLETLELITDVIIRANNGYNIKLKYRK